jgi:hypothetical protein
MRYLASSRIRSVTIQNETLPFSDPDRQRHNKAITEHLEEAVSSEPVGLGHASTVEKTSIISILYGPIPYASEQGIFYGLAGNLNRRSGKFPP